MFTALTFVDKKHETDDVYTFSFSPSKKPRHTAGQHGVFILPSLHRPHPFSLTSTPSERLVSFATHVDTGSPFKRKLMNLKSGAKLYMIGPILNFTLDAAQQKHVLLAQGIGITPFRSMIVDASSNRPDDEVSLIHVDNAPHAFKDETAKLSTRAAFPASSEAFRELVQKEDPNQVFYLSGSPKFVASTKKLLLEKGVTRRNIRTDSFLGY